MNKTESGKELKNHSGREKIPAFLSVWNANTAAKHYLINIRRRGERVLSSPNYQ
jgi:hypothetical protein